jgi:hypothetical protein
MTFSYYVELVLELGLLCYAASFWITVLVECARWSRPWPRWWCRVVAIENGFETYITYCYHSEKRAERHAARVNFSTPPGELFPAAIAFRSKMYCSCGWYTQSCADSIGHKCAAGKG